MPHKSYFIIRFLSGIPLDGPQKTASEEKPSAVFKASSPTAQSALVDAFINFLLTIYPTLDRPKLSFSSLELHKNWGNVIFWIISIWAILSWNAVVQPAMWALCVWLKRVCLPPQPRYPLSTTITRSYWHFKANLKKLQSPKYLAQSYH